jgi:hypothetical protein
MVAAELQAACLSKIKTVSTALIPLSTDSSGKQLNYESER